MSAQLDLTKPLSAAMLEAAGACPEAVALVRKHFGTRPLRLTRERLRKAARLGLNMDWLARHLTPKRRRVYVVSRAEAQWVFNAAVAEALRVYAARAEEWQSYYASGAGRGYYATADALADVLGLP